MHKNAQKFEWKTHSKISCYYTLLLFFKIAISMMLYQKFFTELKAGPVEGQSLQQKDEKSRKTKGEKTKLKTRYTLLSKNSKF